MIILKKRSFHFGAQTSEVKELAFFNTIRDELGGGI